LVGAAVNDLLRGARQGRNGERLVTLTGPPPRVIRVSAQVIFDGQRPLGAVAVIDDRTEATRIDQVRRDLVANLSHELRTPIGAIALLAETLSGESDGAVRERLIGRISTEADRVGDIIEDLLELSRVELEGTPRHDMVDVEALLASAADLVRASAGARGVRLARLPAPGDLRLVGDRGQLLTAVVNLLENAINYSDADSEIELGSAEHGTGTVDIVVRDRGIGIPQHEHERIFERFYRVDKARSRGTGGTGLGLSIVRHIVVNHDGEILVRSREGEGATFTLRLPSGSA
jgi:two-component system, OmpR family, sensor histidine kinase SenX3